MEKKIKVLVIGELGHYSLFAEGYLRFYSAQKLKIKTSAFHKLEVSKKVQKILAEDMIPSKEVLIPLADAKKLSVNHLLLIGDVPDDFNYKGKNVHIHTFKVKKDLSLEKERDAIKKKMLKFLDKQGYFGGQDTAESKALTVKSKKIFAIRKKSFGKKFFKL
ncbi:MAG: hypothetical protein AAF960_02605 [Bacteroidota bacterium]